MCQRHERSRPRQRSVLRRISRRLANKPCDGRVKLYHQTGKRRQYRSDDEKLESARWVEHVNQTYASLFTSFVAHTNRVGYEDGLHFWGGATVFDPNGKLLVKGPYHEEALTFATLDLNQLHRTRARLPLLRDERTNLVQNELNRILSK